MSIHILTLPESVLLRILSFVNQPAYGICRRFDELEDIRKKNKKLAALVQKNYTMVTNVKCEPLWLILANKRVALLLGETHFYKPNLLLNSLFCRSISGEKLYLTEQEPPAKDQIFVEKGASIFRWESSVQRRNLDIVIEPIFHWKNGLIRSFVQVSQSTNATFASNIRIYARLISARFEQYTPFVGLVCDMSQEDMIENRESLLVGSRRLLQQALSILNGQIGCLLTVTNPKREWFLARKCALTIEQDIRPIVIAGSGHVHTEGKNRTLDYLATMRVFYLALVPKEDRAVALGRLL